MFLCCCCCCLGGGGVRVFGENPGFMLGTISIATASSFVTNNCIPQTPNVYTLPIFNRGGGGGGGGGSRMLD